MAGGVCGQRQTAFAEISPSHNAFMIIKSILCFILEVSIFRPITSIILVFFFLRAPEHRYRERVFVSTQFYYDIKLI